MRGGAGTARRIRGATLLLAAALAAGLCVARMTAPQRLAQPDTYWYLRQAQVYAGTRLSVAAAVADRLVCADMNRVHRAEGRPANCRHYRVITVPRYVRIFTTRPGYPLVAAPFVAVLGPWRGIVAVTVLIGAAAGALLYAAVRLAGGSPAGGLLAVTVLYLLPPGFWLSRLLPDGAALAGCTAVVAGTLLAWRGRLSGLVPVVGGLAWTYACKSANGVAMTLALLAASALAAVTAPGLRRGRGLRGVAATAVTAAVALAAWSAVSAAWDLPSLNYTVQDLATRHFATPDIPHPLRYLLRRDLGFWPEEVRELAGRPWVLPIFAAAVVVLVRRLGPRAWPWLLAGLTGPLVAAAHPLQSEFDRLMLPVWLPVAGAAGLLLTRAARATVREEGT